MPQAAQVGTALASDIQIRSGAAMLQGELSVPGGAKGVVLFAHGSGSSRHSPRNQFVARTIREAGVGTLLFDLLTSEEEAIDMRTRHLRFDIGLLAQRLIDAAYWIKGEFDYLTSTPNADPAGTGLWLTTPGRPSRLPASRIAAFIGVVPRASQSRGTPRLPTASETGRPPDRRSPSG